jgi:type III secretion protein L
MVQLVELTSGAARAVGPGRVLKAEEATRLLGGERIRAAAEAEAATLLAAAKAEATALVAAAAAEADAVRDQARREGIAAGEAEVQDLLFEIAGRSIDAVERTESQIIDLGLEVARRVIGEIGPTEATLRTAMRGLRLAARSGFVRLRVAPEAVNAITERVQALLPSNVPGLTVEVIGCPRVAYPGAVLETDTGLIDATIDSQLEAIRRALSRRLGRQPPVGS